jgi:hypothetical protein
MRVMFSGSVAFSEPIILTNHILIGWSRLPWYGGRDLCGTAAGAHALSMFHYMGVLVLMHMVRQSRVLRSDCVQMSSVN